MPSGSDLRVLRLDPVAIVTPGSCACCSAPAASSRTERLGPRELLVPYCVQCLRHASAATTRGLAASVGSCLVAATMALALPMAWPSLSLPAHLAAVLVCACLPLSFRALPRRPKPGHSAAERAAWWLSGGRICCTSPRFAEALATQTGAAIEASRGSEPRFAVWLVAGPLVALIGAPSGWMFHHPLVRVLNLTEGRLTIALDGRTIAALDASSAENPTAGAELRMPGGDHELTSTTQAGNVVSTRVPLRGGSTHLFAPQSPSHCFWLEESGYGRHAARGTRIEPLVGQGRFWVLPRRVDTWFSPNPPPSARDQRSSGGVLVALRQAPCARAPQQARP